MSALSKVFVGLLVVLSLLLSSAVIVWVNKTEDFKLLYNTEKTKCTLAKQASLDASTAEGVAKQAHVDAIKSFGMQIDALQAESKTKDSEISKKAVDNADLSGQLRQQNIALVSATEAVKASEAQKKLQAEQLAELRTANDKILKEKSDLGLALSDVTNRHDVVSREYKFVKEQLGETQKTGDTLLKQLKDAGINPNAAPAGLTNGAPAINGVIREVRTLDDQRQWATISIGSADAVQKGMEFKVIDRTSGSFLGILTVQSVQPNEAVGVLAGPKVADVKVGNEVRTQL